MARPRTNPPSKVGRYLLPVELLELIKENAIRKTAGNQSYLVKEVLEGRMTLDKEEN